jgi:hypothetical protein
MIAAEVLPEAGVPSSMRSIALWLELPKVGSSGNKRTLWSRTIKLYLFR